MAKKNKSASWRNPVISVIIPVRSLSYFLLFENLPKMNLQTFENFEVIVLPNEHTTYDLTLMKQYSWLRIIPTGKITRPAQKRDIGVQNAKGKIIAFIDDDAYPDSEWLQNAVKLFQKGKFLILCGPGVLPENTNIWEKIFDNVLVSLFGSGKYAYRFTPQQKRYVIDYPSMNFFIHKKTFEKVGGFNSEYWPGEDSKLCNDIVEKEKGRILYHPDVLVYHHRRSEPLGFLRQHGQYGFHRGAFFSHGDRNSKELTYLAPLILVLYLGVLPIWYILLWLLKLSPTFYLITSIPLALYCLLMIVVFIQSLLKSGNFIIAVGSSVTLVLTHIYYGLNFIKGLKKGLNKEISIYAK